MMDVGGASTFPPRAPDWPGAGRAPPRLPLRIAAASELRGLDVWPDWVCSCDEGGSRRRGPSDRVDSRTGASNAPPVSLFTLRRTGDAASSGSREAMPSFVGDGASPMPASDSVSEPWRSLVVSGKLAPASAVASELRLNARSGLLRASGSGDGKTSSGGSRICAPSQRRSASILRCACASFSRAVFTMARSMAGGTRKGTFAAAAASSSPPPLPV
mmetsp:Transcript_9261/g.27154  ORF Transcript_9261/g.27154 Transcript_9261/m.27154 type:complete len:216 (-) Transcript_9261:1247-1894(-)